MEEVVETTLEENQISEMRLEILQDIADSSKDDIFKIKLKQAKYIALGALYPFDLAIDELPIRIAEDWQVRCAIELYNIMGTEGYTQYSENGLSWQRASELVSSELMSELPPPKAGVPQ